MKKLQEYMGPVMASTAVDTFFGHWPQEHKDGIKSEFFDMNNAEIEYSTCKKIFSQEDTFDKQAEYFKHTLESKLGYGPDNLIFEAKKAL